MSTTVKYDGSGPLSTSGITTVNFDVSPGAVANPTINASGVTTINANADLVGTATLNLAPGSLTIVNGGWNAGTNDISGAPGSMLVNNGNINSNIININEATVVGNGSFSLESGAGGISGFFGSGLSFIDHESYLAVVTPQTFFSKVDLDGPNSEVCYVGITADSYDFKNDLLTLYNGNAEVYQVKMDAPASPFVVEESSGHMWGAVVAEAPSAIYGVGLPEHHGLFG
jgi:hypothetical protein